MFEHTGALNCHTDVQWLMPGMAADAAVLPEPSQRVAARHYILEDHAGYPIECPICGQVDRWRGEHDAHTGAVHRFVCRHPLVTGPNDVTYQVASVSRDEVGAYLNWANLLQMVA